MDVITRARAIADAILVVDDGSTDDTPQHIRATGAPCLRLTSNAWKGVGLEGGSEVVLRGAFDGIVTVDGDG